jgi:CheY-like chemotaxis protein
MSRILLADDSPHAQRMGERILREEGYEVVTVTDGETALLRLDDVDPDLILADVAVPSRSGYQICEHVKRSAAYAHIRVILTSGAMHAVDREEATRVRADGSIQKPFEASVLLGIVGPLLGETAQRAKVPRANGAPASPKVALIDPERVRAAVTMALDSSMPAMIDAITEKVLVALDQQRGPKKRF